MCSLRCGCFDKHAAPLLSGLHDLVQVVQVGLEDLLPLVSQRLVVDGKGEVPLGAPLDLRVKHRPSVAAPAAAQMQGPPALSWRQ